MSGAACYVENRLHNMETLMKRGVFAEDGSSDVRLFLYKRSLQESEKVGLTSSRDGPAPKSCIFLGSLLGEAPPSQQDVSFSFVALFLDSSPSHSFSSILLTGGLSRSHPVLLIPLY